MAIDLVQNLNGILESCDRFEDKTKCILNNKKGSLILVVNLQRSIVQIKKIINDFSHSLLHDAQMEISQEIRIMENKYKLIIKEFQDCFLKLK